MVTKRYLVINRILQDLIIEFTKIYLAMLCSTKLQNIELNSPIPLQNTSGFVFIFYNIHGINLSSTSQLQPEPKCL